MEDQVVVEEAEKELTDQEQTEEVLEDEGPEFKLYEHLGITEEDDFEQVKTKVQAKLGIDFQDFHQALSQSVQNRAEELTLELPNIAPLGDYGRLLEDNDSMAEFLKTEGHKPEHWKLQAIRASDVSKELLNFSFRNTGVDDGETLTGFVFTTMSGKIKHAFTKVES